MKISLNKKYMRSNAIHIHEEYNKIVVGLLPNPSNSVWFGRGSFLSR